jgi:hypothetical protein
VTKLRSKSIIPEAYKDQLSANDNALGVKRTKKGNITNFLATLFCTFVIIGNIGNTAGIGNSFAQTKPLAIQSPSTISMSIAQPQKSTQNKTPTVTQPQKRTQNMTQPVNSTHAEPPPLTHQFLAHQDRLGPFLRHQFFSGGGPEGIGNAVVVGSDRFRFIKSFWTSSDVSATPTGDNPCPGSTTTSIPSAPPTYPTGSSLSYPSLVTASILTTSALNIEVDRDEGYATLAIILQYQGVVPLAGISAALRLPSGFAAQLPLETDRNNYNIALSNIAGTIKPGDSVGVCFPLNILPNAVVQLPVLGPLALHFNREDKRLIHDSMRTNEASSFTRALLVGSGTPNQSGNVTSFSRHTGVPLVPGGGSETLSVFNRFIPGDYVNQLIPVIWKVTGREILDVSLPAASPGAATSLQCPSSEVVKAASTACIVPVNVVFSNLGDVGIHNLVATFAANFTTARGPAVTTTAYPLGIVNHAVHHLFSLPAGSNSTRTMYIRTALQYCSAIQPLSVSSTYTNAIGQRVTQANTVVLQIQRSGNITSGQCQPAAAGQPPGPGSNGASQGQGGGTLGPGPGSNGASQGQGGGTFGPGPTNSTTIVPGSQGQGGGTLGSGPVKSITIVPRHQGLPGGAVRLGPVKSITIVPRSHGQGGGALGPGPSNSTTIVPRHS